MDGGLKTTVKGRKRFCIDMPAFIKGCLEDLEAKCASQNQGNTKHHLI